MSRRVLSLVRKEFIHILRDPRMLGLTLLLPVIELMLFGYAINMTIEHLPTVVSDQAQDRPSRQFVTALVNSGIFDVTHEAADPQDVRVSIDRGDARIGILIPPDFARLEREGRPASVQVLIDGSDPNTTQAAIYAVIALGERQAAQAANSRLELLGGAVAGPAIEVRPLVLYNPSMVSVDFMIPGLIGLALQLQTVLLTAFAIVGERERGTLEQLIVTPIRSFELMLGKIIPHIVLAFAAMLLTLSVSLLWFRVEFAGSLALLLVLSMLFLFSALGLGLLISTVSETQGQVVQFSFFIELPSMLLTGFIFPLEAMPLPLHDLGYLLPLTYFLKVLRGIMLKGVGLDILWNDVWPMGALGLGVFALSAVQFRKQLT